MNDFDFLLHRTILDGNQFDSLIPASKCQKIDSGNGNTELSMEWIKEVSLEFYPQLQKVAKVLQKETLQKTCEKIHWFAYNHFQYMADDDDQMLRSPSCSWKERQTGIDCKSYSIIASALLLNLELKHYIRKIKQPGFAPTEWTHVYVVVPKNQTTGSLKDGYYTIDGTIPTISEPSKIENKDLYMNHYKLNGASGLNASFDIKGFMKSLGCIGGSAYKKENYESNVTKIVDFFNSNIAGIENAIATKNMALLSDEVNEVLGFSKLLALNFRAKRNEKSWNNCSGTLLDRTIDLSKFYSEGVAPALTAYIDSFFTKSANGSVTYTAGAQVPLGIWGLDNSTGSKVTEPKFNYTLKSGVTSIPKFEITPYVAEKLQNPNKPINLQELLSGFSTIISSFGGGSSNNGNTTLPNYGSGTTPTGEYTQNIPVTQKTAGLGITGWLLILAAGGFAFTQMKAKPMAQPRTATRRKTTAKK